MKAAPNMESFRLVKNCSRKCVAMSLALSAPTTLTNGPISTL